MAAQQHVRKLQRQPPASPAPPELQPPLLNGFSVHEATLADLHEHFAAGHFTYEEYTAYCLSRIEVLNPHLSAIIETNPDACALAAELDTRPPDASENVHSGQQTVGPLYGIPVLLKDNIATADRTQTTAGSLALVGSKPKEDAHVVKLLREAGAIPIGKANMSEWASLRSKTASAGYSPRGGQCRNPYDLEMSPFSSSAGSAAAVAAGMVPVALGTETDTSVIGPAGANGVVGIKPGVGVTSRRGTVPISGKMDVVGCFGRTVADAAAVLEVISGPDPSDEPTTKKRRDVNYREWLTGSETLKGAKFGIPFKRCWEMVEPSCKAVAEKVVDAIRKAGAEVVEVDFPSVEERVGKDGSWDWERGTDRTAEWTVAKVDGYNGMTEYLQELEESKVRSVEDVVEFNKEHDEEEGANPGTMPNVYPKGQDNLEELAETKGVEGNTYHAALRHIREQTRRNGIDAVLSYTDPKTGKKDDLDALLFCDRKGIGQQYAAQAGYPVVCIPIGVDKDGIPVSLSFQHSALKEPELVKWASAVEDLWNKENGWRPLPAFKNLGAKNVPIGRVDD
ncbi:putative amidase family protein [Echria macrotheca]|uniref:Amidase family protein n=1 Tax=Echria macrotheca TaxID=438768 RepID=A0AAJ0BK18_9PEZI|nr:putative amidase family protein [Echria macrotheca]